MYPVLIAFFAGGFVATVAMACMSLARSSDTALADTPERRQLMIDAEQDQQERNGG